MELFSNLLDNVSVRINTNVVTSACAGEANIELQTDDDGSVYLHVAADQVDGLSVACKLKSLTTSGVLA